MAPTVISVELSQHCRPPTALIDFLSTLDARWYCSTPCTAINLHSQHFSRISRWRRFLLCSPS